eukprot:TRINITY_DN13111_c0_g1_i1.p1 TRINITY_DN13111_c0_g1~~TRINITY_DN13111_c0_g1_i1.p1  ORF type:complete len:106 (-),score=23.22 TRINITY_DN13111_c0_g1_i1:79-396(-)
MERHPAHVEFVRLKQGQTRGHTHGSLRSASWKSAEWWTGPRIGSSVSHIPLQSLFLRYWPSNQQATVPVSYTHLRAHETVLDLVCRLLLAKKKINKKKTKKEMVK